MITKKKNKALKVVKMFINEFEYKRLMFDLYKLENKHTAIYIMN